MKHSIHNGHDEADNSSQPKIISIQVQTNDLLQQSQYIAAISKFVGCEGLVGPVTDTQDETQYNFDFLHKECGRLFKIFKGDSLSEYEKYALHPGDGMIIVNVDAADCVVDRCGCCKSVTLAVPTHIGDQLYDTTVTYLYFKNTLWEYAKDSENGISMWEPICPFILQEREDDEEEEEIPE